MNHESLPEVIENYILPTYFCICRVKRNLTDYKTRQVTFQGHSLPEEHSQKKLNITGQSNVEQVTTKQEFANDEQTNVKDGLLAVEDKEKQNSLTDPHMEAHEGTIEKEWCITRNTELTQRAKRYFPIVQKNYKEVSVMNSILYNSYEHCRVAASCY